jgi:hypothetical protein
LPNIRKLRPSTNLLVISDIFLLTKVHMDGYTLCKKIKVDIFLNGIYSEEEDEY